MDTAALCLTVIGVIVVILCFLGNYPNHYYNYGPLPLHNSANDNFHLRKRKTIEISREKSVIWLIYVAALYILRYL